MLKTLRETIWKTMMTEETVKISDAELELQLPRPVGYRILVALPQPEETVAGTSILKTETAKTQDHIMSIIGWVVDMGNDAYGDEARFPDGPWCKQGDWVVFGRYAGSRLKIEGGEVRLLNDDEILGTVDNPEDILTIL